MVDDTVGSGKLAPSTVGFIVVRGQARALGPYVCSHKPCVHLIYHCDEYNERACDSFVARPRVSPGSTCPVLFVELNQMDKEIVHSPNFPVAILMNQYPGACFEKNNIPNGQS